MKCNSEIEFPSENDKNIFFTIFLIETNFIFAYFAVEMPTATATFFLPFFFTSGLNCTK